MLVHPWYVHSVLFPLTVSPPICDSRFLQSARLFIGLGFPYDGMLHTHRTHTHTPRKHVHTHAHTHAHTYRYTCAYMTCECTRTTSCFLCASITGPGPLEALANGCPFIQPKFNPPHSGKNTVSYMHSLKWS